MGIFDRFQAAPEPVPESRARTEFRAACEAFRQAGDILWASCEPNRAFAFPRWKLRITGDRLCFLPDLIAEQESDETLSRALPLEFRRAQTEAVLLPVPQAGTPDVGILSAYDVPDLLLRVSGGRAAETVFRIGNTSGSLKTLTDWGFSVKPLYGMFDRPEKIQSIRLLEDSPLLPKTSLGYHIWRQDAQLFFQQRANALYCRARSVKLGCLPVSEIESFQLAGEIRTEQRITGGKPHLKARELSFGERLLFGNEIHACDLDDRVEVHQEPLRLETFEHDERVLELRVNHDHTLYILRFAADAITVFESLLPEKRAAAEDNPRPERETSPAEQLEILANLVDRGYLTRAEFDEAKPRLLAKL